MWSMDLLFIFEIGGFVHVKGKTYSVAAQNVMEPKQGQMYGKYMYLE